MPFRQTKSLENEKIFICLSAEIEIELQNWRFLLLEVLRLIPVRCLSDNEEVLSGWSEKNNQNQEKIKFSKFNG